MSHEVLNVGRMTCDHRRMAVIVRLEDSQGGLDQINGVIEEAGYRVV